RAGLPAECGSLQSEEEEEEEEEAAAEPGPAAAAAAEQRREERLRRFRELHMKRYEACKLNSQEVVEEDKRLKLPPNWEAKKARLEWELQVQEKKKVKNSHSKMSPRNLSAWDSGRRRGGSGWVLTLVGLSEIPCGVVTKPCWVCKCLSAVSCSGEALYPTSDSLLHGTHVPSEDGVHRMVADLEKQIEKREKYSRRRPYNDDADIDYINERNAKFNQKAERFYGKYTAEIKQNLERGTAV
ncbi:SYF2 factor, partial [Buphagus erythrorhynchus]|nr:SYF2 factor [Buphagus erythrorhynchus]